MTTFRITPANTGASNSRVSTASSPSTTSTTSTASSVSSVLAASLAASAASVSSCVAAAWLACGRGVRTTKTRLRRRLSTKGHSSRRPGRSGRYQSFDGSSRSSISSGGRQSLVIYLGDDGEMQHNSRSVAHGDVKKKKGGAVGKDRVIVRAYEVSSVEDESRDDDDDDDDDYYFDCRSRFPAADDDDRYAYTWTNEASKSAAAAAVASALAAYRTVAGPDDCDANWI